MIQKYLRRDGRFEVHISLPLKALVAFKIVLSSKHVRFDRKTHASNETHICLICLSYEMGAENLCDPIGAFGSGVIDAGGDNGCSSSTVLSTISDLSCDVKCNETAGYAASAVII